ncbi:hypothetical protein C0583_04995 [Candidatus Parcubacteria bacterium]|nr:MAG: hypothetical protein C0583_04995 [Candidatus Parcubacteria bacterium]
MKKEVDKAEESSSILNKILISFFLFILFMGISINYYFQVFLTDVLIEYNIDENLASNIINSFIKTGTLATIVFSLVSLLVSYFVAKGLINPIKKLKEASLRVANGEFDRKIEIDSDDEIGSLANAFNKTLDFLFSYKQKLEIQSKEMENLVENKTLELKKLVDKMHIDKKELEKQRAAILNILEDVQDSQEELEASKIDLENRHFQLEILKSLGDKLTNVIDVREAVNFVYEHLKQASKSSVITLLVSNPFEEGDLYFKSYLNENVSENYIDSIKDEIIEYIKKNKKTFNNVNNKILEKICPSLGGEKLDNSIDAIPKKSLLIPLSTGENFFGIIHLSYCEHVEYSDIEDNLSRAIGATLSVTIAHLHALDKSQHSKTESLVKSLSDGVIMFTVEKNVVLTNSKATFYTGLLYSSANLYDFIRLFPGIELEKMIDGALERGVVSHINEVLFVNKFYEITISPVKDNDGGIVGGAIIIHDITYIKEIDRMKTEFVSVASHQLRTPLTAVKLFSEALIEEDIGKINEEQKEHLENIHKSTTRMIRLVNDLLNVTRIESGRLRVTPRETDINEYIKNLITEAKPSARISNVKIEYKEVKLPKVMIDQNLFRQVIQNLISNAIRYSKQKNGKVGVKVEKDNVYYIISVSDNGIGIPKGMQERIFEKFYRADNAIQAVTEGTGLGLYASKMIVDSSGGKIWFDSNEGKGTVFYVKMPLTGMLKREGERGLAIS